MKVCYIFLLLLLLTVSAGAASSPNTESKLLAGRYRADIYCHSCPKGTPGAYIPEPFEVVANEDGTLSFWEGRWKQIEPLVFQLATGPNAGKVLVAFRKGPGGRITYMFQDMWSFERLDTTDGK